MSNKNKKNHLYVFVKGHKGKGAFEITDSDYQPQHIDTVIEEGRSDISAPLMDLKAIEKSLEYIKDHRGNDGLPDEPVISIFTTYKTNYYVAAGLNEPQTDDVRKFKQTLAKLQADFVRAGQKQHDEVRCFWVPDNFGNHFDDVKKLLDGEDS